MKRIVLLVLVLLVAGIVGWSLTKSAATQVEKSSKARSDATTISQADVKATVAGNTACAFDLYQRLRQGDSNLVFSPYSISTALAMTYAGARGSTEKEMAKALHISLPQARFHAAFNSLDSSLARTSPENVNGPTNLFSLDIANSLWAQKDYRFLPAFLDTLAVNYGTGVQLVDFQRDPDGARRAVNAWASEKTQGKIQDVLPPDTIDPMVRLVLVNAVYFKDKWLSPFEKKNTKKGIFHLINDSTVDVDMMSQQSLHTRYGNFGSGIGYEIFSLPYRFSGCEMIVILPARGQFAIVEQTLTRPPAAQMDLTQLMNSMNSTEIALTMPKFKTNVPVDLISALKNMGMKSAFSMTADFSGMDGTHWLFISQVRHRADITVDEEGTEAAAATAVAAKRQGITMPAPVKVVVDRPFIYLIRDTKSGSILFMGRVMNPKG